ncbi:MAG: hypothetical protein LAN62_17700 [Acidobacteriia bacterium]|nr:hypothetical protein [Terriglobia bacterium]
MANRVLGRLFLVTFLCAATALSAAAQYPGGGTMGSSTGRGYGNGAAIGAGVGAAVGGAALIYWATHHQATLVGCVRPGADGNQLVEERTHQTYSLVAGGDSVKPGERVQVQGKKVKADSGSQGFRVKKVAKVMGSCEGETADLGAGGAARP